MSEQLRILLIGVATLDLHVHNVCMPGRDDASYLQNYRFTPGGSALNMAFSLVQLGSFVSLCTRLGNDFPGAFVREFMERLGLRLITRESERPTTFSIINVADDGRMGIAHFEGANDDIAPADVPIFELAQHDVLHIGGALSMDALDGEPLTGLLKQAKSLGKIVSVHTSRKTRKKHLLLKSLPYIDYLFMNALESSEITGRGEVPEAANWLHDRGVQTVAITLGPDGAFISSEDFAGRIAAQRVSAVDSSGCGDAFTAGFLAGVSRNLDILECAVWGNVVGGICAVSHGPLPQPFTLETVQSLAAKSLTKQQA
jgi:sugar/nucleoside kinase (ribokinase family)